MKKTIAEILHIFLLGLFALTFSGCQNATSANNYSLATPAPKPTKPAIPLPTFTTQLMDAAKEGDVVAQTFLGDIYYLGGPNVVLTLTSDGYHARAQSSTKPNSFVSKLKYADLDKVVRAIPQDSEKALHWYAKAATQGDATATKRFLSLLTLKSFENVPETSEDLVAAYQRAHKKAATSYGIKSMPSVTTTEKLKSLKKVVDFLEADKDIADARSLPPLSLFNIINETCRAEEQTIYDELYEKYLGAISHPSGSLDLICSIGDTRPKKGAIYEAYTLRGDLLILQIIPGDGILVRSNLSDHGTSFRNNIIHIIPTSEKEYVTGDKLEFGGHYKYTGAKTYTTVMNSSNTVHSFTEVKPDYEGLKAALKNKTFYFISPRWK